MIVSSIKGKCPIGAVPCCKNNGDVPQWLRYKRYDVVHFAHIPRDRAGDMNNAKWRTIAFHNRTMELHHSIPIFIVYIYTNKIATGFLTGLLCRFLCLNDLRRIYRALPQGNTFSVYLAAGRTTCRTYGGIAIWDCFGQFSAIRAFDLHMNPLPVSYYRRFEGFRSTIPF